jgi:hypothetical protein
MGAMGCFEVDISNLFPYSSVTLEHTKTKITQNSTTNSGVSFLARGRKG